MNKWLLLLALAVTLTAFSGGISGEYLNWDDRVHHFQNPDVIHFTPANFFEPFRHLISKIYVPLTSLSFALEYQLFGADPHVSHLINLLLHLCNVGLVFAFARKIRLGNTAAFAAALLFGVHPMHVESVMWISERKDVLYSVFYLLAMMAYWDYLQDNDSKWRSRSILFFVLSMLAKPMALSLPLILILLDWFAGRKIGKKVLVEKIPFFAVAVLIGVVSYWFNARIPITNPAQAPLIWTWSFSFYLTKFIFPVMLSPLYYLPEPVYLFNPVYLISIIIFVVMIFLLLFSRNRWFIFALLFYLLSIFFLLRFDAAVDKSVVADRFMYLPSLGICLAAGVFIEWLSQRPGKQLTGALIVVIFALLTVQTYRQCLVWQNSLNLWNRVIAFYPQEAKGYSYRANAYITLGNYRAAVNDLDRAVRLDEEEFTAYHQKGWLNFRRGRMEDALKNFNVCLGIRPDYVRALNARGVVYASTGRIPEAIADFSEALRINPRDEIAMSNLVRAKEELR